MTVERPISMTDDDHERIWLQPKSCVDEGEDRQWCEDNVWPMDASDAQGVEYVRADIHTTRIEDLRQQVERLTDAGAIFVDTANTYEAEGCGDDKLLYFSLGELKEFRAALTEKHNG